MACKQGMTLDEIDAEMKVLCAEVKQIEAGSKALTKDELEEFKNGVGLVVEELMYNYGTITTVFKPEVPAGTQKMFVELEEFWQW